MIICRAILKATFAGTVQTRNMFCAQFPLASTMDADIQTAMVNWVDSVLSPMLVNIVQSWAASSIQLQQYVTGTWNDVAEVPFTDAGSSNQDFEEFQTAVLLTARTYGLKVLGKKFLAGLDKAASMGGLLTAGVMIQAAASLAAYVTPFVSTAGKVGNPGVLDKNGVFWEFIGGTVGSILSTMRRRKPGYGI